MLVQPPECKLEAAIHHPNARASLRYPASRIGGRNKVLDKFEQSGIHRQHSGQFFGSAGEILRLSAAPPPVYPFTNSQLAPNKTFCLWRQSTKCGQGMKNASRHSPYYEIRPSEPSGANKLISLPTPFFVFCRAKCQGHFRRFQQDLSARLQQA